MNPSVAIIGTRGYPSYYGGFETLVRNLAPHLVNCGWDVTVYGRTGTTEPDDKLRDPRVKTINTLGLDTKSLSTLSFGFTSVLDSSRRRPDVALVMNVANGFWLPALKARRIPTIVNVDGIEWEREKWGKPAKAAFKAGARATAMFADELVFDSKEIGRRWKSDFRRTGTFIPYGGNVPEALSPLEGLPKRSYALMVARFVPENTVEQFFEAAEILGQRWNVAIVGSSGYRGEFDERAAELAQRFPRIHWFGHVSDDNKLFALWQNAGVYFHGHSVGGTNPALVQALACRVPIVARDTIYNREVLENAGLFVAPHGSDIADALEKVLSDTSLQDRLSTEAFRRRGSGYTWKEVCDRYTILLDKHAGRLAHYSSTRASQTRPHTPA